MKTEVLLLVKKLMESVFQKYGSFCYDFHFISEYNEFPPIFAFELLFALIYQDAGIYGVR